MEDKRAGVKVRDDKKNENSVAAQFVNFLLGWQNGFAGC